MSLSLNKKIAISSMLILVMSFTSLAIFLQNSGEEVSHESAEHGKASVLSHDSPEDININKKGDTINSKIDAVLKEYVDNEKNTVIVADIDGEILYSTEDFNSNFNLSKNIKIRGENLFDCIYDEDISDFTKTYAKAIKKDGTDIGPVRIKLANKEYFVMLTAYKYEVNGEVERVIFSVENMTEKFKKFKNQTANSNKELAFLDAIYTGIVK